MLRTITIGKYISVQGIGLRMLPCGRMEVQVGDRIFTGQPVGAAGC